MKILLLRANSLRHQSLAAKLQQLGFLCAEIIEEKVSQISRQSNSMLANHFLARNQSEEDFFGQTAIDLNNHPSLRITEKELNTSKVYSFLEKIDFDLAITFGVSILREELIRILKNRILGIHLGLSPYYRGSGTNFFPFVNSEISAVGFTLMHLNSEIDKGSILHQGRAPIVMGDSIHSVGNRNIVKMNQDIARLIKAQCELEMAVQYPNIRGKFYKRKDFNVDVLKLALRNLNSGMIEDYLENKIEFDSKFKLVHNKLCDN